MHKISIPKPCFETWEQMTPDGMGRYCNSCATTVVDFSVMSDAAVQQYFIDNYNKNICGRFKNTQLQRIVIALPQNIFRIQLPFWKKFLVAFFICFGGSFLSIDIAIAGNSFTQGNAIVHTSQTIHSIPTKKSKQQPYRKKKRNGKRYIAAILPDIKLISTMISGYTTVQECKVPILTSIDNTTDAAAHNEQNDTTTTAKNNRNENRPAKDPAPAVPYSGAAFILPSILNTRNPFSKKKKA